MNIKFNGEISQLAMNEIKIFLFELVWKNSRFWILNNVKKFIDKKIVENICSSKNY